MNKRIVSVCLCIALTIIPTLSSFATEPRVNSDATPTPTATISPTSEKTDTVTPSPSSNRTLEETTPYIVIDPEKDKEPSTTPVVNKSETPTPTETVTPTPTETVTPTPTETVTPTPTSEPTNTPTPTAELTETPTPGPTPVEEPLDEEDPSLVKSLLKGLFGGPLRGPSNTTWQNNWNYTLNVTSMHSMFQDCSKLTSLDVSGFDTSNVITMDSMFRGCRALTSLDVSGFDTSSAVYMMYMFDYCNNLTSLDVSGFDTSNVIDMSYMFSVCSKLTVLDLSGFNTSSATNMTAMMLNCHGLNRIVTPPNVTLHVSLPGEYIEEGVTPIETYTSLPLNTGTKILVKKIDPESITVDPTSITISVGDEFTITPTVLPTTTTDPTVTWSSDTSGVATVDSNGKVTGIAEGTATITAKTINNKEASCAVTVTAAKLPTSISVNPTSRSIAVDEEFTITATVLPADATDRTVTWSSDKPAIATVTTNGKVKGISAGTATITAKTVNNLTATCEVTVTPAVVPVTSITVNPTTKTINVNEEFTVVATVLPTTATDRSVTWSSDKPAIATVDTTGKVKGVAVGTATITAKTNNNLTATCDVTVRTNPGPGYSLHVIDNRTSAPHPEMLSASVTNLAGNRYFIISDSNGDTIKPWIRSDSSLKYDSVVFYDMRLTDSSTGGTDKTDFGECTVRIALPSSMSSSGNIRIVTMKDGKIDKSLAYSVGKVNGILCITFTTGVTADYGDKLITLVTCTYQVENGRFVVIGRRTNGMNEYVQL